MIKFENTEVLGFGHAIRGCRNPMNSWDKSDSEFAREIIANPDDVYGPTYTEHCLNIGPNDYDLMRRLRNAGTDHRKFMRMITVYTDITAPLYWWKEFSTYKVGTVENSCSTMHKIHAKEFTLEDFSCEHLIGIFKAELEFTILKLNIARNTYLYGGELILDDGSKIIVEPKDKQIWWQMIQLLPSSYNQKRTVMLNYEVLANIYKSRKNHKLDEWREHSDIDINTLKRFYDWGFKLHDKKSLNDIGFCDWIKTLPYSELITGQKPEKEERED